MSWFHLIPVSRALSSHRASFHSLAAFCSSSLAVSHPSWEDTSAWPPSARSCLSSSWVLSPHLHILAPSPQQPSFLSFPPEVWPLEGVQTLDFWSSWSFLSLYSVLSVTWVLILWPQVYLPLASVIHTWLHQVSVTRSQGYKHLGWCLPSPAAFSQAPSEPPQHEPSSRISLDSFLFWEQHALSSPPFLFLVAQHSYGKSSLVELSPFFSGSHSMYTLRYSPQFLFLYTPPQWEML